ncbi:MAG TPA: multiheme c-type cytochrome, partial [Ignavibacteria bacterium]|nr:multiheme c-type cytochrome [Ignavibacteria bacterium]
MKKISFILLLTAVFAVIAILINIEITKSQPQSQAKYVGVTTCLGACHKSEKQGNQLEIWKNSKHSQAFKSLQTPFADSIANAKGHSTAAAETPECVVCHVLGREMMP